MHACIPLFHAAGKQLASQKCQYLEYMFALTIERIGVVTEWECVTDMWLVSTENITTTKPFFCQFYSEMDSLDGTVGRRPQVNLRSRARHWSGCTLRPIECEHRALDLRLTWGFLPQGPFKKPVSVQRTLRFASTVYTKGPPRKKLAAVCVP